MRKLLIAVGALVVLAAGLAGTALAAPVVQTDKGRLRGREEPGLQVFLGVPFARPPLGDLRWRDPQPAQAWTGVRDATTISAACLQEPPKPFGPYGAEFLTLPAMSEDCLYLNVWAPRPSAGKAPVLVFIHGGAFQSGSTSVPLYDGARLARKGVVVVTLNYRLGVFGFLAHPELTRESPLHSSGDYGLLDMIAALRWVRTNIGRFGGDPADVTISGQSAGAIAVNQLLASPLAEGLFRQAIAESGPTLGLKMRPLAAAEEGGVAFARRVNAASIADLRAMPAEALFSAFRGPGPLPSPPFFPLPVLDGKVVFSDPELPTSPIVSPVPLMVGFNRDEAQTPVTGPAQFAAKVKADFGPLADRVLGAYPHATDEEAQRSAVALAQDRQIAGLLDWAGKRSSTSGQRVYVYLFDHPYPGAHSDRFRTFHTAEVPYVFGTLDAVDATAEDRAVSEQLQARWLAFLRSGDPSVPGAPWADVRRSGGRVMLLGDRVGHGLLPASDERRVLFRDVFAQVGK